MGIRGLNKIIKMNYPQKYDSLDKLLYDNSFIRTIAIDANLYAYKYAISVDDVALGFLTQCSFFLSRGIMPIYVMDNFEAYPSEKLKTQQKRIHKRKTKKSVNFRKEMVADMIELFGVLGIPCIYGPCEADYICASLSKLGIVDACLSDDLDIVAFGGKQIIRKEEGKTYLYSHDTILSSLKMSWTQLLDFCVMLGSDYNVGMYGFSKDPTSSLETYFNEGCSIKETCAKLRKEHKISYFENVVTLLNTQMKIADEYIHGIKDSINLQIQQKITMKDCETTLQKLIKSDHPTYPNLLNFTFSDLSKLIRNRNYITSLMIGDRHRCI